MSKGRPKKNKKDKKIVHKSDRTWKGKTLLQQEIVEAEKPSATKYVTNVYSFKEGPNTTVTHFI